VLTRLAKNRCEASDRRVAYVLNGFPVLSETFILNEIIELRRQRVEVHIFSLYRIDGNIVHTDAAGLATETAYLENIGRRRKLTALVRLFLTHPVRLMKTAYYVTQKRDRTLVWSLKQAVYLASEVTRLRVGHMHSHFAMEAAERAMLAGMLTGIPYSVAAHAVDIYVYQRMLREKMNRAKFVVTESAYNKNYLLQYNQGSPGQRIHVIRLGIDPDAFARNGKRPERPRLECALRIVSVARLVEKKGLTYLIHALGRLRREGLDTRATIVGDGPQREGLAELIAHHGLESAVLMVGAKDSDAVKGFLGEADLFVLPCIIATNGDRDGTPTALVEAMAMGIPVVSTTVAGIPEIVPPTAGFLVPPKDSVALADAIKTIYRMEHTTRNEMGKHGREYVLKHCNLKTETQKLVELFLAAPKPGG